MSDVLQLAAASSVLFTGRNMTDSQNIPAFPLTNTNTLFLPMLCDDVAVGPVFVCDLFESLFGVFS